MLCILAQSGFRPTPPSRDATPWIINKLLVKSKFSPLFTLAPCLYAKPSIIHSLNSYSFGLYEITLSWFFWALSEHLSSCFFLSWPLLLVVLSAALCPPIFSHTPLSQWSDSFLVSTTIRIWITPAQTFPLWFVFPGGAGLPVAAVTWAWNPPCPELNSSLISALWL